MILLNWWGKNCWKADWEHSVRILIFCWNTRLSTWMQQDWRRESVSPKVFSIPSRSSVGITWSPHGIGESALISDKAISQHHFWGINPLELYLAQESAFPSRTICLRQRRHLKLFQEKVWSCNSLNKTGLIWLSTKSALIIITFSRAHKWKF